MFEITLGPVLFLFLIPFALGAALVAFGGGD